MARRSLARAHLQDRVRHVAAQRLIFADLETGYEDYRQYRGDGGHVPATEPGAYGHIHFANGVRGSYAGGSKTTPGSKSSAEVIGTTGRILLARDQSILYRGEEPEPIEAPEWPVEGIPAGVQELVRLIDEGGAPVSPGRAGLTVVEIIIGFLESQHRGNAPIPIPVPREYLDE